MLQYPIKSSDRVTTGEKPGRHDLPMRDGGEE
jgi:hypothetical protein